MYTYVHDERAVGSGGYIYMYIRVPVFVKDNVFVLLPVLSMWVVTNVRFYCLAATAVSPSRLAGSATSDYSMLSFF